MAALRRASGRRTQPAELWNKGSFTVSDKLADKTEVWTSELHVSFEPAPPFPPPPPLRPFTLFQWDCPSLPPVCLVPDRITPLKAAGAALRLVSLSVPTAAVTRRDPRRDPRRSAAPQFLLGLKVLFLQRLADPRPVAVDAERLEELLLRQLEGHGRQLGLRVGRQREEVGAAAPQAEGAEQAEQVGLGHAGDGQFVPGVGGWR